MPKAVSELRELARSTLSVGEVDDLQHQLALSHEDTAAARQDSINGWERAFKAEASLAALTQTITALVAKWDAKSDEPLVVGDESDAYCCCADALRAALSAPVAVCTCRHDSGASSGCSVHIDSPVSPEPQTRRWKECAQCLLAYPLEATGLSPCCEALLITVAEGA